MPEQERLNNTHLDQLSSSYFVILILTLATVIAGSLFWIGLIKWTVTLVAAVVRISIEQGFEIWRQLFAWASWQTFLLLMSTSLFVGWLSIGRFPFLTILCAVLPVFMGFTASLAYMRIDLDRYAVSRGYKSVHNPLKGQELAVNLVNHGQAVGLPLLVAASIGMVGGFALLNFGLYETIGRDWYLVKEGEAEPTYVDFLANAFIVLLKIVDVLDFAKASHLLDVSYVRQVKWPSTTLVTAFRMFFTVVLLQQVFASLRQGLVLSETISDLWNPNEPIHERACQALPQHGPGAVGPLLVSLGKIPLLTKEQRERLPAILAAIGPAAIPSLLRHLHDAHDHVRAIAAASLGHFRVRETVVLLVPLSQDSSDMVRQSLIEALGIIAGPGSAAAETKVSGLSARDRFWLSRTFQRRHISVPGVEPVELAVKTLQSALNDESLSVRGQAAHALGRIGSLAAVATHDLIELLKDEDETVRKEAIEAIGKVGGSTPAIVSALADQLGDPSPLLRATAAKELGEMKEAAASACPALVPLLQDREESVRDAAAIAIGQIGYLGEGASEELVEGLASRDSVVRAQTADALGTIGKAAHETAAALVDVLDDRNDMVRAKAVEALGKIGEAVADIAVPGLVRALQDEDNVVRSLAAEALGEMGTAGEMAIPNLIRSLHHLNADVRASAAESLGKLDVDAVGTMAALERACEDEDADVRSQAILSLSMISNPRPSTRQAVLSGLNDANAEVRTAAVEAFCRWGNLDETSLDLLLLHMEDPNEQVRATVTKVLPHLAGATPAVIEGLCSRLREDTDAVQAIAACALGELGPAAASAGATLLRSAQTGEANVRERSIEAIQLIRPSESLAMLDQTTVEPGLIEALREIEGLIQEESTQADVDVIPTVVVQVSDPQVVEQIEIAVTLIEPQIDRQKPLEPPL